MLLSGNPNPLHARWIPYPPIWSNLASLLCSPHFCHHSIITLDWNCSLISQNGSHHPNPDKTRLRPQYLIKITNSLLSAANSGLLSILILLDFTAAFHTIYHPILLHRLSSIGLAKTPLQWFHSYLSGRTQFIQLKSLSPTSPLHWLPITFQIQCKILLLTFRAIHKLAPLYLSDLLHIAISRSPLRSSPYLNLTVPPVHLRTMGGRAFSHSVPHLCNSLPPNIRNTNSLPVFKSNLKIHLFCLAYSLHHP